MRTDKTLTDSIGKGNKIQHSHRRSSPSKGMKVKKKKKNTRCVHRKSQKTSLAEQKETHRTQIRVERSAGTTTEEVVYVTERCILNSVGDGGH